MSLPQKTQDLELHFTVLDIGEGAALGPFQLERAWRIDSRNQYFGGYSALLALSDGQLLTLSDNGATLHFTPPERAFVEPSVGALIKAPNGQKATRDVESVTADLSAGQAWAGLESENSIMRFHYAHREFSLGEVVQPAGMADWGNNSGPESLVRLRDGSFLVLREGFSGFFERRRHAAIRFAADPVEDPVGEPFILVGPEGFSPTDMAQLPDGRVLVLFRRLLWPVPAKFAGALAIGDPRTIRRGKPWQVRQLASWATELPGDNFEGIAIEPGKDARLTVWLISDDNRAAFQKTMLWKLSVDPADLPARRKKARGNSARPSP
ncbi:MAG: esterase-like activity of phytase family protein [Sphingomonadaceae bacterium]|nr:esterase-like activity of phytase family protein [Sphingomonadaceae bacterium]